MDPSRLEARNPGNGKFSPRGAPATLILLVLGVSVAGAVASTLRIRRTPVAARSTQAMGGFPGGLVPRAAATSDCSTDTTLCLGGRFLIDATWTKPDGESGPGHAVALTSDSGYFWFLEANNVEVAVKALNGCFVDGHFWIFSAGLTNLAVAMTVTDTVTNETKTYSNPQGTPFQTITDTSSFADCPPGVESSTIGNPEEPAVKVAASIETAASTMAPMDLDTGCVGSDTVLCLSGRFQVEATWQTASGRSGVGHAANLTSESGYFWFFDPSNVELVVKALDACAIGGGQWFFSAGMTTVGVQLNVTDTLTGEVKTYANPTGVTFVPILDTAAFSFCPATPTVMLVCDESPGACYPHRSTTCRFAPRDVHVRVGDTITWTWAQDTHSITSGIAGSPDGRWDSGARTGPFQFSHTFTETGTFPYFCKPGHVHWQQDRVTLLCSSVVLQETGLVIVDP